MLLDEDQDWDLDEDEEDITCTPKQSVQPKFIKELNFQQNAQRWRQRRIRQRKNSQITSAIYQKLKHQVQTFKSITNKPEKRSQTTENILYKGHVITGKFKKKLLHGDTQIVYRNGAEFEQVFINYFSGIFINGKMQSGHFDFKNGFQFWGQLQGKHFMGKGILQFPDGKKVTAIWNKFQTIGRVQIQYPSQDTYYGQVNKDYQKHGNGYLFFKGGSKYVGHFVNGQINGYGEYYQNGKISGKGQWKDGVLVKEYNNKKTGQFDQTTYNLEAKNEQQNLSLQCLSSQLTKQTSWSNQTSTQSLRSTPQDLDQLSKALVFNNSDRNA